MRRKYLFLKFLGFGGELLISGIWAALYTYLQDTGRGFDPNPVFWQAFITIHLSTLMVLPLFLQGRTLGMLLTNMSVVSTHGGSPHVFQSMVRAVLGFGPVLLTNGWWLLVSAATSVLDKKGRSWGELISFTTMKPRETKEK
ncbi:RDD family protein [Halobacillus kuroshimensis]|uniref:RDD family protein n=1 Tax=Halobacillus kuroshimensis TaxID=302481 RepID=A0ABS3DTW2_9BACI|nr:MULTISPECIES: RDD family protein [Halobacillus]MBN8234799.1 RDD family protein [Halobacillus kuroshimensis]